MGEVFSVDSDGRGLGSEGGGRHRDRSILKILETRHAFSRRATSSFHAPAYDLTINNVFSPASQLIVNYQRAIDGFCQYPCAQGLCGSC